MKTFLFLKFHNSLKMSMKIMRFISGYWEYIELVFLLIFFNVIQIIWKSHLFFINRKKIRERKNAYAKKAWGEFKSLFSSSNMYFVILRLSAFYFSLFFLLFYLLRNHDTFKLIYFECHMLIETSVIQK